METVQQFIATIGRQRFMEAVGVGTQVVTRAISENAMPTPWFMAVRCLCESAGIETPEHLFKWSGKVGSFHPRQSVGVK